MGESWQALSNCKYRRDLAGREGLAVFGSASRTVRRFTRLTNGFSKKVEILKVAVSLHFAHYNFVRLHSSFRVTPAMVAGVSDKLWSLNELVEQTSR
jgi:hypothetical protein